MRDVAEFDFDVTVTLNQDIGAEAKLGEKLSAKLDANANIAAENARKLHVKGVKTYTNYNLTLTSLAKAI